MSQLGNLLRVLRSQGYKVTAPRKQVLEALKETSKPLSAYEIQKWLQGKGKSLNPVTIYRILNLLCSLNLAHRVPSSGGFVVCTLNEEEGCHRFVVCRYCGSLQEFASKTLCQEETEITRKGLGFQAEYHLSEVSGLCSRCQGREG